MSIQDWGAIGEIIGGIAIIISLLYVGSQISQSRAAAKAQASQSFIQAQAFSTQPLIEQPAFRELYSRGLGGMDNLHGSEKIAFVAWIMITMRSYESFYYQHQADVFDDHLMKGWGQQYIDALSYPGGREAWDLRRHQFSKEFRDHVDALLAAGVAKPLYPLDAAQA